MSKRNWRNVTRVFACGICWFFCIALPCASADLDPEHASRLVRLVRQDCGSCHGLQLTGGLGPSLLPAALADKPATSLVATILGGRRGTPMPPWRGLLTEQEAQWIVERLLTEFPKE